MATEHLKKVPATGEQRGREWELRFPSPLAHLYNPVSGVKMVNAQSEEGKLSDDVRETVDFPASLSSCQIVRELQSESQSMGQVSTWKK